MALKIYPEVNPAKGFSNDNSFSNPLTLSLDGSRETVLLKKLYVRNDDNTLYFENTTVTPFQESGDNIVNGTDGYSWKLIAGDKQPLDAQWDTVGHSNSINIPNIGASGNADISTYEPFWLRVVTPRGAPVKSHPGVKLRIETDVLSA